MTEDRLAGCGRRVPGTALARALAATTTALALTVATVGCGAQSSQPLSLRAGTVVAEPIGSATPQPAGVATPRPAGVATPQPAGVATPRPAGVATPEPADPTRNPSTAPATPADPGGTAMNPPDAAPTDPSSQPPATVTVRTEPAAPVQGQPVRFRATTTGGAPTSWRWRILALLAPEGTDLQTVATSGSPSFSHTFPTAGRGAHYLVQLTVANDAGGASAGQPPADGDVLDVAPAGDRQGS